MRQLNFYNFRKVNRERTFWVYKHPMFHRDRPGDLGRLRRKTCPGVDGRKKQEARVEDGQSLAASSSPANQNQSNASSYNKHYQYSKQYTKQYSKQVQYKNQQQSKQNSGNSASGTRTSARLGRPPRRGSGSGSSGNSATIGGGFHSPMMQQQQLQQLQHDPYHSGNGDVDGGGGGGGSAIPGYGHLPCSGGSSPVFECGVSHPHPHPHPHVHVHGGSYLEEGVDANDSSSDCDETSYAKKRPRAAQSGGGGCFGDGGKGKRSRNERSERSQMVAAVSQQLEAYARRAREQTKHGYDDEDSSDDDDGNGEEDEGGGGGCGSDDYRDGNGAMPAAGTIKLNQIKNGAACEVPTRFGNGIEGGTLGCVSAPPSRKQADQSTCSVNGKGSDAVEIVRTVSTERSGMSAGGALAPGHGAVTNRIGRPRKNKRGGRRKETSELSDTMRWSALTYDDEVVDVDDDGQGYGREKATSNRPSNATPMRKGGCVTPQSSASRSSSPPISVMSSTPSSYKRLDVAPRSYFEETRNAGHSSSSSSDFVADSGSGVTFPKLSSTAPCSSTVNFIGIKCSLPALTQFCLTTPPNTVIEKSTTLRDLLGRDEDVRKDFEMYRLALSPRSCLSKHQDDDDDDDDDEGDDEDREHRGAQGDDEKKDDDDEDGGGGDEGGRCGMPGEEGDRGTGPLDSFKAEKENASSAFGVPPPPPHAVAALSLAPLLRSFFPYCANHVAEIISDNIEELGNKNVWIKAKEQWLEAARATQ